MGFAKDKMFNFNELLLSIRSLQGTGGGGENRAPIFFTDLGFCYGRARENLTFV
jgi:hypothetical protein